MKKISMTVEAAKKEIEAKPHTRKGQWTSVVAEVKKTGEPVKIAEITRGQCWALKRTAREAGLESEVMDKNTAVIVLPPKSKGEKK